MSNRIKLNAPTIKTRAQLDATLAEIREHTINKNALALERERLIKAIDETDAPKLAWIDKQLAALTEQVRAWAEANGEEFKGAKSLDTTHATIGWRTGNLALKTLAGWTWDRVLEKIKSLPAMASGYLRVKEEVAKDVIIADREVLGPEGLRLIGVKVAQSESFFVQPKIEEVENRQTTAA